MLLNYEQLETIRMLSNHSMDQDSPLAVLLVGQPTLRRQMKLAVLAALDQRTALRHAMPSMTSAETASCIKHHVTIAGRGDTLFSDDALTLIHDTARGLPPRRCRPAKPSSPPSPTTNRSSTNHPPA